MDALELLHGRASAVADTLEAPAPAGADLDAILRAGVAAPDHGALRPWRFVLVRGAARARLGEVFAEAARARDPDLDEAALARLRAKPLRAPLLVAVVARIDPDNPKIPAIEQVLSAGAAAQQMQLAANALGYGSVWLTGASAYDAHVTEALGLEPEDRIVAFLYMGTPGAPARTPRRPEPADFVTEWHEPLALETL